MITPYIFEGGVLTAAAATYGTVVPVSTKRIIKSASLINTTAAPVQCSVYLVPSGATASSANIKISLRAIAAGETYSCPELIGKGLNAAGFVQALGLGVTFDYTATDIV